MTSNLIKRGNLDTEADMHMGQVIGRHKENVIYKPRNHQKLEKALLNRFFLTALRRSQPCQRLDQKFPGSRTVRKLIFIV